MLGRLCQGDSGQIVIDPNPPLLSSVISVLSLLLILAGIFLSILTTRKIIKEKLAGSKRAYLFYFIPMLYGGIFSLILFVWRFDFLKSFSI